MIGYLFNDPLIRARRAIERLMNPMTWMEPLLEKGIIIVRESNTKGLMLGLDIHGKPFLPVKRKHGGPPLLEHPSRYRAVNYAITDAGQIDRDTFEIRISWPNFKTAKGRDVLNIHMEPHTFDNGYRRPARQAIGIREDAVKAFLKEGRIYLGREFRELFDPVSNVMTRPDQYSGVLKGRR